MPPNNPGMKLPRSLQGALDPAKAPSHIDANWAHQFAEKYNNVQTEVANARLTTLLAFVSLTKGIERKEAEHTKDMATEESSPPLVIYPILPFTKARFTGAEWRGMDESLVLTVSAMEGTDEQSAPWQASYHEVIYDDQLTRSIFSVATLGGMVYEARSRFVALPTPENYAPAASPAGKFDETALTRQGLEIPNVDDLQKVEQMLATL